MRKDTISLMHLFMYFFFAFQQGVAQEKSWQFAHISDIHISDSSSIVDLKRTVYDVNANTDIEFVIISGDITEFGSDGELLIAQNLLSNLNKPWYIIPGNHDMKWSESGGESFKRIFGSETFAFESHGFLFLGTNCGPNMRMSPGQVPRENIVWLDSVLNKTPKNKPIIFVNHYPLDSALNNWYQVIDRLKTHNIQLVLCGHGHSNHHLNFEGIPGIMGRSNLRAKDSIGAYNIVTIKEDSVFYNERKPGLITKPAWTNDRLYHHNFIQESSYKRPSFDVNNEFKKAKELWTVKDESDIGSGGIVIGKMFIIGNTGGWLKAYDVDDGKLIWQTKLGGKIYSTPCSSGNFVVIECSDGFIYCLNRFSGKVIWKNNVGKPMVASAVINNGKVFCGGSDGHMRCYNLKSGLLEWDFNEVEGFIETKPLLYNNMIYFGSWGNKFYALNQETGKLAWLWSNGYSNRMFSPAACNPVATSNRLFIVAPDRFMTCFNAKTGEVIWRKMDPKIRVRESLGLSNDSNLVYVKTMDGDVLGIDAEADDMLVKWNAVGNMGYDISPSPVQENNQAVFGLSSSGEVYAFNRKDGSLKWIHKFSNCLINPMSFLNNNKLICTTMDGKITCLQYY